LPVKHLASAITNGSFPDLWGNLAYPGGVSWKTGQVVSTALNIRI